VYLPERLKADYTKRIDELIEEGRKVLSSFKEKVPGSVGQKAVVSFDREALAAWKAKCVGLSDILLPGKSRLSKYLDFSRMEFSTDGVEIGIGHLRSLQDQLEKGYLTDLGAKIESEIASDYMGQAEALLGEGTKGRYDHVPAAVLSGAVLEQALRTLCARQTPPIKLVDNKGKPKMLDGMISDLKKADLYYETQAKQLRAWAGIRNNAAHGEFEKFTKVEVEAMVKSIADFLAKYLG
jgi:hypothetical protein